MKLRSLPTALTAWRGKAVLVRVDWNIPLQGELKTEDSLKITRTLPLIHALQQAGAKIVVMTHLGRPSSHEDKTYSTEQLVPILKKNRLNISFLADGWERAQERDQIRTKIAVASQGTVFLLENLRFFAGEEKNSLAFAKALASLGDVFVNEAFANSHRVHASMVGVPKLLPSFAGPALEEEVRRLSGVRDIKKGGMIGFFGGKKISSKLPTLNTLQKKAEALYLGGAMATACEAARGKEVGKSYVEPGQKVVALTLLKHRNIHLPLDYVVAETVTSGAKTRIVTVDEIRAQEMIVDVGPQTLACWAKAIRGASAVLWNGPMGVSEISAFAAGSRGLARFLGHMPHRANVVVGGGDTIPLLQQAAVMDRISFVSTGGGAMLDFLVFGEKMPGLQALLAKK